jgi:hypothetical protein
MKVKPKPKSRLLWLFEPFEDDPRYLQRKFFSFDAAYLDGRLCLAVADGEEPWNGLLVCTAHEHQGSLRSELPQLIRHPVLGKWLYLSQTHAEFESVATELVEMVRKRDARVGVEIRQKEPAKVRGKRE